VLINDEPRHFILFIGDEQFIQKAVSQ
jgi:hypothetical protein